MIPRKLLPALALSLVCLLAAAGTAGAATTGWVTNYEVPACGAAAITPASGEGVLVALCEATKDGRTYAGLGTLRPSGKLSKRPLPGGAEGLFAAGPAGEIWAGGDIAESGLGIDRIDAEGTVTRIPLGTPPEHHVPKMYGLVPDGEGAVWAAIGELAPEWNYLNSLGGELLHIAADGTMTRYPVPEGVEPHALVRGPDGNLWFVGESGRASTEHTSYLGKGYVGRMTPAGEFALYPTTTEQSSPGGIAVGPDGRLWFTETSNQAYEIGSIGTDGSFGPSLEARNLRGPLAFGPEGDVWASTFGGVMRIAPWGQHTVFPLPEARGIAAGQEGDIWTHRIGSVQRIVPGAPGIDTWKIEADRHSKAVHVQLACGGSERGCEGTLKLSLAQARGTAPGARLASAHYSVPAESMRELTLHLSAKAFALARKAVPKRAGAAYVAPAVVHATVDGGPTLDRRTYVPGLVTK